MILIELNRDIRNSRIDSYEAITILKENKHEDQETTKAILQGLNHKAKSHNPFKGEKGRQWAISSLCIWPLPNARTRQSSDDHGVHNNLTRKSGFHVGLTQPFIPVRCCKRAVQQSSLSSQRVDIKSVPYKALNT